MRNFLELVRGESATKEELTNFLFDELGFAPGERAKNIFGVALGELDAATMREKFKRKIIKYFESRKFFGAIRGLGLNMDSVERAKRLYALRENIPIKPRDIPVSEKKGLLTLSRNFSDLLPVIMGLKPACNIDLLPRKGFGIVYIKRTFERYGLHCKTYYLRNEDRWVAIVSYTEELVEEIFKIKEEISTGKITTDEYDVYLGLIYGYPLGKILEYIDRIRNPSTARRFDKERKTMLEKE